MEIQEMQKQCSIIRQDIINMLADSGSGHPGGSLSIVEILVALYYRKMRINPQNPKDPNRDRFLLSKGHAAPAQYAVLAELGYFDKSELKNLRKLHSILQGHPDCKKCPGVEASTGSLGQGISIAVGMAIGAKLSGKDTQVYTIVGDGECQEGEVWEASMAAAHYKLDNLTVILDHNNLQIDGRNDEVMSLGDVHAKFAAFGYEVIEINGNDLEEVLKALDQPVSGKPKLILANTIKGKGVSFMEDNANWHGTAPNEDQRKQALEELV